MPKFIHWRPLQVQQKATQSNLYTNDLQPPRIPPHFMFIGILQLAAQRPIEVIHNCDIKPRTYDIVHQPRVITCTHDRTAWLAAPGVIGPTTLLPLYEHLRMKWVHSLLSDFGIQSDSQLMVMWMLTSDVVRLKSNMVVLLCSPPWVTWLQRSQANSLATFLPAPAWNSKMSPMVWQPFPRSLWQDGVRSWHGWHSAKCPRTRSQEALVLLVTLDGSWSHLMIQSSRSANLRQSLPMAVWPWLPSWACSSRRAVF